MATRQAYVTYNSTGSTSQAPLGNVVGRSVTCCHRHAAAAISPSDGIHSRACTPGPNASSAPRSRRRSEPDERVATISVAREIDTMTLPVAVQCGHGVGVTSLRCGGAAVGQARDGRRRPAFVVARASRRRPCRLRLARAFPQLLAPRPRPLEPARQRMPAPCFCRSYVKGGSLFAGFRLEARLCRGRARCGGRGGV